MRNAVEEPRFVDAPLPEKKRNSYEWYDWKSLKVGGPALFFPERFALKDMRKTAKAAAARHGMVLEIRKTVIDGVRGIGIWRIE